LRSRVRLARLERGADLLRRKREALVAELFRLARPASDARGRIEQAAEEAYVALLPALTEHGAAGLRALGWPARDYPVELAPGMVWGVPASRIVSRPPVPRTLGARGTAPAAVGGSAVRAADRFERLVEELLEAAPREMLLRRIGEALARTSRQVNTLERRLAPRLARDIVRVRQVLEEREREERVRLDGLLRRRRSRPAAEARP
ncbi:MAG TPA: V-type ATP synthase subunit D, partial [Gemmatimonadales bacterium]|nr:V-type ATP synthase subunit D [Gemmatimonadales bacterium]